MRTRPSARASGIVSCMRFRQRTKVDLPQPEGPMMAVAWLAPHVHVDVVQRLGLAEPGIQVFDFDANTHTSFSSLQHAAAGDEAHRSHRRPRSG